MAVPLTVHLTADQVAELTRLRDQHPKPYVRERAAAILKVASGWSVRRVALHGLFRPRRPETVSNWIRRYLSAGRSGLEVATGRGRKPASSPRRPPAAVAEVQEGVHRSLRLSRGAADLAPTADPGRSGDLRRASRSGSSVRHAGGSPESMARWRRSKARVMSRGWASAERDRSDKAQAAL